MEHKQVQVAFERKKLEEAPANAKREVDLGQWTHALYVSAMRITAATLIVGDLLDKAASVLWGAGFAVPAGYFANDEAEGPGGLDSEEALRAWAERDEENLRRAFGSVGFYMAGTGRFMDPKDDFIPEL